MIREKTRLRAARSTSSSWEPTTRSSSKFRPTSFTASSASASTKRWLSTSRLNCIATAPRTNTASPPTAAKSPTTGTERTADLRLLVTGGAGFIGCNFVRYILDRYPDYHVVNLDKLTYAGNLENLEGLEKNPRYRFLQGDVCDPDVVSEALKSGADAVVNFAAESHVDRSILGASEFVRTNVLGTLNLLDASRKIRNLHFVQISTDEVYASLPASGTFPETTPLAPNSPYAASKASADLLVRSYNHTYGFPAMITRCSNNYGPYQLPEELIPLLIANALAGMPLPLYGDGLYVRDWIHVQDHCKAVDRVLHHGRSGEIYNIGAEQETTNLDPARAALKYL